MNPIFALIFPLSGDPTQAPGIGNQLPTPPVYPGQGLPQPPVDPGFGGGPAIIIPPDAIAPGVPSAPIYLGPKPGQGLPGGGHTWPIGGRPDRPDQGLPGYGRPDQGLPGYGHPSHPIVYPPGYPSQGLPPTPGLPPLVPNPPIVGVPPDNQIPVMPPHIGGGPAPGGGLPDGSVLLVPVPSTAAIVVPPDVPAGSSPYVAWKGRGSAPVVCWIPPRATP
jgi:hypothetical protein